MTKTVLSILLIATFVWSLVISYDLKWKLRRRSPMEEKTDAKMIVCLDCDPGTDLIVEYGEEDGVATWMTVKCRTCGKVLVRGTGIGRKAGDKTVTEGVNGPKLVTTGQ